MSVSQLTLWHNEDLERGFSYLADLQMDKAISSLNKALTGPCDQDDIQKAIVAAEYWRLRMQQVSNPVSSAPALLQDFISYPFIGRLNKFRRNLLHFIADLFCKNIEDANETEIETIFNLFLKLKDFTKAEEFISFFIKQYPGKWDFLYLLAQAQWLKGSKGESTKNYIRALLYSVNEPPMNRIENNDLKELILSYGPVMAPAYGWIRGQLPFVLCNYDISDYSEPHQRALKGYCLLQQAHLSLENNDTKASLRYRKQLKAALPELYEAYFELLKKRKK